MSAPRIELADGADENGLALMISELLRQNLDDRPEKRRDFHRLQGRIAIVVDDARVAITLEFTADRLVVHDGIFGIPDLTIRADTELVTEMSLVELLPVLGLPDLRREHAKNVMRASSEGRIHMVGALQNLATVVRLTRLMSVA